MRPNPTRRLADLCRALLLVAALGCVAVVVAFAAVPTLVHSFEQEWRDQHGAAVAAARATVDAARARGDAAGEREALEALGESLRRTKQLDWQRADATAVLHRLAVLRSANGDSAAALEALRRLYEIDPNSVTIQARLAERLLAAPTTRAEGYAMLLGDPAVFGTGALFRLPAQAEFVVPAVHALVQDRRVDEARAIAIRALEWPEPKWWSVYWWSGDYDPMQVGGGQPRVRKDGVLVHDFAVRDACDHLRFLPPAFASCVLERPRLFVRRVGEDSFRPLAVRTRETANVKERGTDLWLTGIPDPIVTYELAEPLPRGHHEIRFAADWRDIEPEWLQRLLLTASGEALVRGEGELVTRLATARAVATGAVFVECFWAAAGQAFAGERRLRVDLGAEPGRDGRARFAVDVPVPTGAARVRIDLGAGERLHWRFHTVELRAKDGRALAALDLARARLVQCERKGDEIAASGDDAQIVCDVPDEARDFAVLRLEGVVR